MLPLELLNEDNWLLLMVFSSLLTAFGFFQYYENTKDQHEKQLSVLALICQSAKVGYL